MFKFILNEFYRWKLTDIILFFILAITMVLTSVVFNEPILIISTAMVGILTYFLVKVKSRFAYLCNNISLLVYAYALYTLGIYFSAGVLLFFMFPISVIGTYFVYKNQLYIEDYSENIYNTSFLSNTMSFVIFLTTVSLYTVCYFMMMTFSPGLFPFIDVAYGLSYILAIILVYFEKFEYNLAYILCDTSIIILWLLFIINYNVGIPLLLAAIFSMGYRKLLLVWWLKVYDIK